MSKSVTFSFSPTSSAYQKSRPNDSALPTGIINTTASSLKHRYDSSVSGTDPSNHVKATQHQSTPHQEQLRLVGKMPSDSPGVAAQRDKNAKPSSSVQAETGQLKMASNHGDITISYRLSRSGQQKPGQPGGQQKLGQPPPVNACTIAERMRQQHNHQIFEQTNTIKHELAALHEHSLKLEEEIKLANKSKHSIEVAIQDIRKGISVNQQTISAQQKRRREEVSSSESLFLEEAKTLSNIRRKLESHFHVIKQHLHVMDGIRKQLQNKLSTLSKTTELNAHSFKLYHGPSNKSTAEDGRPRQYGLKFRQPIESNLGEFVGHITEGIRVSRSIRAEIKELVNSAQSTKQQAHAKVTTAISQSIDMAKAHQRNICLERGQLRLQQNAAAYQAHKAEIALGIVSGPISEKYKTVAQSDDRPLMRSRPVSAIEEKDCIKNTKASLSRQISTAQSRRSSVSSTSQKLNQSLSESCRDSSFDSQLVRIRKMSLDNRWVT